MHEEKTTENSNRKIDRLFTIQYNSECPYDFEIKKRR